MSLTRLPQEWYSRAVLKRILIPIIFLLIRVTWACARLMPDFVIRAMGRLLYSKTQRRFEEAVADPAAVQLSRLQEILQRNRNTDFGREHYFDTIRSFDSYRQRVPIRTYDQLEPYIDRMVAGQRDVLVADDVTFFARSSGTSGKPKYIPVTQSFVAEYRACRRLWSRALSQVMPGLVRGHMLTMHSPSIEGYTKGGVPYGSITVAMRGGREAQATSPLEGVPRTVYTVADIEAKYYLILRSALDLNIALFGALNPSTLVLLCQKLTLWAEQLAKDLEAGTVTPPGEVPAAVLAQVQSKARPNRRMAARIRQSLQQHSVVRVVDLWPRLCGVLSWKGGSAPFFLHKLRPYIGELPVMDYSFAATEGNFAVTLDAGDGRGVAALIGHVLEFIPEQQHGQEQPETKLLHELEIGQRYALVVTASNGLYRYDINDIVEVVDSYQGVPVLSFLHKGGSMISLTGEKVGEAHVVAAMDHAIASCGISPVSFLVTARLADPSHYCLAVELDTDLEEAQQRQLLRAFDDGLKKANIEYLAKRDSLRLAAPHLLTVPAGCFEQMRVQRVDKGAPDAHVKVPHLWRDAAVLQDIGASHEIELEEEQ